jgi:hypothetical protein
MTQIITPESPEQVHSEHDAKMFGSPKDRLDFYRREIQYETSILSHRTDAYLAAQSFLVIAFASCMANLNPEWGKFFTLTVPPMLAVLGLMISLNAWPGIRAARIYSRKSGLLLTAFRRPLPARFRCLRAPSPAAPVHRQSPRHPAPARRPLTSITPVAGTR